MAIASVEVATSSTNTASHVDFQGLVVEQMIVHRVLDKSHAGDIVDPKLASGLTPLNDGSRQALQKRLIGALGSRSHGIELSIDDVSEQSFFQTAVKLFNASEADFIAGSGVLARALAKAQASTTAPAGMLAVMRGKVGSKPNRFVAVIKADMHDGFHANETDKSVDVTYLEKLMLTPTQKLYKVGLLLEVDAKAAGDADALNAANYRAFLFDHLLTSTETGNAATYFYASFLGMGIRKSAKFLTQLFFEKTTAFIESAPISREVKFELKEALRTELRSNAQTINPHEFAKLNFPDELRLPYREFLDTTELPKSALPKDTQYVKTKLRARKFVFDTGIRITAPADSDSDAVCVQEEIEGRTIVSIRGSIQSRE